MIEVRIQWLWSVKDFEYPPDLAPWYFETAFKRDLSKVNIGFMTSSYGASLRLKICIDWLIVFRFTGILHYYFPT